MNRIITISILTITAATLFSVCSFAQSHTSKYMHIDYIMVSTDQEEEFLFNVRESFLPVQSARKENGTITDWYLYRVTYPGSQNSAYNFVVITISESMSAFEDVRNDVGDHLGSASGQQQLDKYKRLLSPNHSELWRIKNSVLPSEDAKPSRYIVMNYMTVGLGYEYEYQMFEDEVARPIHEERMERDVMKGWELHELIIPGGLEYGYNFSTMDYFDMLEHIEFGMTEELIRMTHPDTNINEFFNNIYRTRDLVRNEVWEYELSLN